MRLGGVIIAAGRSSRLGQPKALLTIEGEPILGRLVRTYRAAGIEVVAVTSADLAELAGLGPEDWVVGDPRAPMIDSYARGIAQLSRVDGAILQPVDAAFTDPAVLLALGAALEATAVVPHYAGTPGHPVALPASSFAAVLARPTGGLRSLLVDAVVLDWPQGRILCDLDTPEDLVRWGLATK